MSNLAPISVRVTASERDLLRLAAEQAKTNLSDFIRRKAIEAAELAILERRLIRTIPAADWEKFEEWVNSPPRTFRSCVDSPRPSLYGRTKRASATFGRRWHGSLSDCSTRFAGYLTFWFSPARMAQSGGRHFAHQRHPIGHGGYRRICRVERRPDGAGLSSEARSAQSSQRRSAILLGQLAGGIVEGAAVRGP